MPAALEASLSDVDLGDGLRVKMPKPQGRMPTSLAETVVAPQSKTVEGYVKAHEPYVCGGWGPGAGKCMKVYEGPSFQGGATTFGSLGATYFGSV